MQAAGTGLERNDGELRVLGIGFGAVPEAGTAVDAFFAIKNRAAVLAGRDGLAGTHFHTDLAAAGFALGGVGEGDVVGVAVRGLDFAAHEQGVLMRD